MLWNRWIVITSPILAFLLPCIRDISSYQLLKGWSFNTQPLSSVLEDIQVYGARVIIIWGPSIQLDYMWDIISYYC